MLPVVGSVAMAVVAGVLFYVTLRINRRSS